jgi:restriction system protein
MLPILRITSDGQEHTSSEASELLTRQFSLSEADLRELLPSGKQAKFTNRIGWATTYLRKTKLLEGTGRGRFRITDRGRTVLYENPDRVDLKYLGRYQELAAFRGDIP